MVAETVGFLAVYGQFSADRRRSLLLTTDTYYRLASVSHLLLYPLVGLVAGLAGRLYVTCFYLATDRFSTWQVPAWLKPALAGAVVGLLGLAVPGVLGTGYGQLQHDLDPARLLAMPWWRLVAVPLAEVAATSLSIGSGGSGGVFGPGLVIGGSTAGLLWRVLHLGGLGTHDATGFVIVGMVACFGAIAHAPLSVVLMVAEMTGNLAVLPVAMIAVTVAVAVVGDTTIYRSQLRRRSDSPTHRFSLGLPASASLPISRVMAPPRLVLPGRLCAADALGRLGDAGVPGAPVVNGDGAYIGSIDASTLANLVGRDPDAPVARLADAEAMTLPVEAALDAASEAVTSSPAGWVPVLDDRMAVVGVVATSDVVRGWRLAMRRSMRLLAGAAAEAMVEVTVGRHLPGGGRPLDDLGLPLGSVIISIARAGSVISPKPDETVLPGDVVTGLVRPGQEPALRLALEGPPEAG